MVEDDNRHTLLIDKSNFTELEDIGLIRYDMLLNRLYHLGEAKIYYDNDNDYIEIKNSEDFEEAKKFGTGQFIYIFIDVPKQSALIPSREQLHMAPEQPSLIGNQMNTYHNLIGNQMTTYYPNLIGNQMNTYYPSLKPCQNPYGLAQPNKAKFRNCPICSTRTKVEKSHCRNGHPMD